MCGGWLSLWRFKPAHEAAEARRIASNKEAQIKHVAKKLMTTMDAIQLKFDDETQAVSRSGRRDQEAMLSELRARRDSDMRNLEAQVPWLSFEQRALAPCSSLSTLLAAAGQGDAFED